MSYDMNMFGNKSIKHAIIYTKKQHEKTPMTPRLRKIIRKNNIRKEYEKSTNIEKKILGLELTTSSFVDHLTYH